MKFIVDANPHMAVFSNPSQRDAIEFLQKADKLIGIHLFKEKEFFIKYFPDIPIFTVDNLKDDEDIGIIGLTSATGILELLKSIPHAKVFMLGAYLKEGPPYKLNPNIVDDPQGFLTLWYNYSITFLYPSYNERDLVKCAIYSQETKKMSLRIHYAKSGHIFFSEESPNPIKQNCIMEIRR